MALTALLALAILLPLALLDRPLAHPRLTFIGDGDRLSVLIEGAGGGRVLLGGGNAQTDVAAALGRRLRPWDHRLDLLLITDPRDLPGAVELVQHGDVRLVATVGLEDVRSATAGLVALRDACARRGVPLQAFEQRQRIRVGTAGRLTLEVAAGPDEGGAVRLVADGVPVALVSNAAAPASGTVTVVLRANQETYRAALGLRPGLLIAPAPPPALPGSAPAAAASAGWLIVVGPGDRVSLTLRENMLRVEGAEVQWLDGVAAQR